MNRNFFLCLFGISIYLLVDIVAREAILGGTIAEYATLPYQVTIITHGSHSNPKRCGGGILNEHSVITAAHCLFSDGFLISRNITIFTETYDLTNPGLVNKATRIFVPLGFNSRNFDTADDIAVIRLRTPLENVEIRGPRRLQRPRNTSITYSGDVGVIAGFGYDQMEMVYMNNSLVGHHTDNRLRVAGVRVLENHECQNVHPRRNINAKHLCARVMPSPHDQQWYGACDGDEGAPLVWKKLNQLSVIGILSQKAYGCSEASTAGIYTRVANYLSFVTNAMNNQPTRYMHVETL